LSGAKLRYGFAREALREPAGRFLLTKTISTPIKCHVIVKNLMLVSGALGIEVPLETTNYEFPIAIARDHEDEADQALVAYQSGFAILNPGGGWPTKLWSAERFGRLADELWTHHGLRSIVTFGPGEEELANSVVNASSSERVQARSLSLKGFVALARRAAIYVGGDTGPTHLAVAAGAPVVGLFGPTEWWRNGSPRIDDICVERNDIGCRTDCHRRACSNWICMDIDVERVLNSVSDRLARVREVLRVESETLA
jgi:ADP-heptose:LPS heptosyltransferase